MWGKVHAISHSWSRNRRVHFRVLVVGKLLFFLIYTFESTENLLGAALFKRKNYSKVISDIYIRVGVHVVTTRYVDIVGLEVGSPVFLVSVTMIFLSLKVAPGEVKVKCLKLCIAFLNCMPGSNICQ